MHHHEVGNAGQCEIGIKFDSLVNMADKLLMHKYIVKNTAAQNGYTATFMPKPIFQDNGSGMHTSVSMWKGNVNIFYDEKGYGGLSETALYYIGGILKHARAPARLRRGQHQLLPPSGAGLRGPDQPGLFRPQPQRRRPHPRWSAAPRASASNSAPRTPRRIPYLLFSAMAMAGHRRHPEQDHAAAAHRQGHLRTGPRGEEGHRPDPRLAQSESLDALEADHEFLLKGDVFSESLIQTYIDYKRVREVEGVALRPHPYEFFLYYDA